MVQLGALRGLIAEHGEEAGVLAAHLTGLIADPVELFLLAAGRLFIAPDLLCTGRIDAAAVDHGKLRFKPDAHRIAAPLTGRLSLLRLCRGRCRVHAEQCGAGQGKVKEAALSDQDVRHFRP